MHDPVTLDNLSLGYLELRSLNLEGSDPIRHAQRPANKDGAKISLKGGKSMNKKNIV